MAKSALHITAKVLPGNKLEIQTPDLLVGQTVEVILLLPENLQPAIPAEETQLSLRDRIAFLKLPLIERRRILARQADKMVNHYQNDSEWRELMAGDIIDY